MMDQIQVESYAYLWNGPHPGWVLVRREDPSDFSIYNEQTRMLLVVDDEEIRKQLLSELTGRKVKVLSAIPSGEFDPDSLIIDQ
jgi:hypothetical protein